MPDTYEINVQNVIVESGVTPQQLATVNISLDGKLDKVTAVIAKDFNNNPGITFNQTGTNDGGILLNLNPVAGRVGDYTPRFDVFHRTVAEQNGVGVQSNYTAGFGLNLAKNNTSIDLTKGSIGQSLEAYFIINSEPHQEMHWIHNFVGSGGIRPITYAGSQDKNSTSKGLGFTASRFEFANHTPSSEYDVYLTLEAPASANTAASYYRFSYAKEVQHRFLNNYAPLVQQNNVGTFIDLIKVNSSNQTVVGQSGYDLKVASNQLITNAADEVFNIGKSGAAIGGLKLAVSAGFVPAIDIAHGVYGNFRIFVNDAYGALGNPSALQLIIQKTAPDAALNIKQTSIDALIPVNYTSDLSASYTSRSMVDKAYVDARAITSGAQTFGGVKTWSDYINAGSDIKFASTDFVKIGYNNGALYGGYNGHGSSGTYTRISVAPAFFWEAGSAGLKIFGGASGAIGSSVSSLLNFTTTAIAFAGSYKITGASGTEIDFYNASTGGLHIKGPTTGNAFGFIAFEAGSGGTERARIEGVNGRWVWSNLTDYADNAAAVAAGLAVNTLYRTGGQVMIVI